MQSNIIVLGLAVVFGATYFSPWVFSVKVGPPKASRQSHETSERTRKANGMHASFVANEMTQLEIDTLASKPTPQELEGELGSLGALCEEVQGEACPPPVIQCKSLVLCPLGWVRFHFAGEKGDLVETMKAFAGENEKLGRIEVGNMATVVGVFAGEDGVLDPKERSALKKTLKLYGGDEGVLTDQARGDLVTTVNAFKVGGQVSKFNTPCFNEHGFNLFMAVVDNGVRMSADIGKAQGEGEPPISTLVNSIIKTWLLPVAGNPKEGVERLSSYDEKVKTFGAEAPSYVNKEKMAIDSEKASAWCNAHNSLGGC